MKQVTRDEFFARVNDGRNVHPQPKPDRCVWRDQGTQAIFGYTYPGYLCRDADGRYQAENTYFLEDRDD